MTTPSEGQPTGPAEGALRAPAVARITRLSALETVRARVALAVDLGLLTPGDRLPPTRVVADALAVSLITARRALETLAADGVLVRRPGREGGTFVAEAPPHTSGPEISAYTADADTVHALIERRLLAECTLAHIAALTATDDDIELLRSRVADMASADTWAEYHLADQRFHLAAAAVSGQVRALDLYRDALTDLYRYFLPYPIAFLRGVNDEHTDLVDALEAHDPVRAVEVSRRHVGALHETMFVGLRGR